MDTVTIAGFAPSTYVRTARLVCAEKDIDYSLEPLDFQADSHRALHPFLKMPALRHGDTVLFETLAIATYLNDEFAGPDLAAGSAIGRARMFQWISAANDYIYNGIVGKFAKADSISPDMIKDAIEILQPVERALAGQAYLAGDDMTLADLFLLPMLLYAEKSSGKRKLFSGLPEISAWLDRLRERPSVPATEN